MIIPTRVHPNTWQKEIWIARKKDIKYDKYGKPIIKYDDDGNVITEYEKPVKYYFNYQPVSSSAEVMAFGTKASTTQKAVIPLDKYKGKFKEFDLAYLNGATPKGEVLYGDNANYVLDPPKEGNNVIIMYFNKLTGK